MSANDSIDKTRRGVEASFSENHSMISRHTMMSICSR